MKGHHHAYHHTHGTEHEIERHIAKHRKEGGEVESPKRGVDEAEEDLKKKNERYTPDVNVEDEAEAKKAKKGGRIKRRRGGEVKHVGEVKGEEHKHHAGRRARKAGGAACEADPFTSARHGTPATGRKLEKETEG
jgi:hypothetical protein